jgi:DNA-binding response OmpR family regulator
MWDVERVAIIDDDPAVLDVMCAIVRHGGWEALPFETAEAALPELRAKPPQAAFIDLFLPGMDGIAACKALRGDPLTAHLPIILITGSISEESEVLGFSVGADDVIRKPVTVPSVLARLRAVLRRTKPRPDAAQVTWGPLVIEPSRSEARLEGRVLNLTPTELRILTLLASSPDRVHTRADLLGEEADDPEGDDRRVDTHVSSLRRKLGVCWWLVDTVYGQGYRLGRTPPSLAS